MRLLIHLSAFLPVGLCACLPVLEKGHKYSVLVNVLAQVLERAFALHWQLSGTKLEQPTPKHPAGRHPLSLRLHLLGSSTLIQRLRASADHWAVPPKLLPHRKLPRQRHHQQWPDNLDQRRWRSVRLASGAYRQGASTG